MIEKYLKGKVALKLLGGLSFPVFIFILVSVIILSICSAVLLDSETANDDDYLNALARKQSLIETNTDVKLDMAILYAIDNVNRKEEYSEDTTIHISNSDSACFISNKKQISKKNKSKAYQCMNYSDKDIKQFEYYYSLFSSESDYKETTNVVTNGVFTYPVDDPYVITAGFNSNDSVHNGKHEGVDFVPLSNENIKSSSNGTVIETVTSCEPYGGYIGNNCGGGFGNHVVVETKQAKVTYHLIYGHMSEVKVSKGDKVSNGTKLGIIGNSGNTTGKHVHLQIEKQSSDGTFIAIDPMKVLTDTTLSDEQVTIMQLAGVNESDYEYVDYIVSHESSWDYTATNSSSGAYGLCQALPGNKMASAGSDWKTNPVTQMKWCDAYATDRYGTWQKAKQFWQENEWW